jgi:hypothetical protein
MKEHPNKFYLFVSDSLRPELSMYMVDELGINIHDCDCCCFEGKYFNSKTDKSYCMHSQHGLGFPLRDGMNEFINFNTNDVYDNANGFKFHATDNEHLNIPIYVQHHRRTVTVPDDAKVITTCTKCVMSNKVILGPIQRFGNDE